MDEQIQKNEENIMSSISLLTSNKNPLSIIFLLADLKDVFISIAETFLNSVENNYSEKSKQQYFKIVSAYKQAGIFETIYNYYLQNDGISQFKHQIEAYFYFSFFHDISFFYFTLSQDKKYKTIFDILEIFFSNKRIKKSFFLLDTYLEKQIFLNTISVEFTHLKNEKDIFYIIKFLNHFHNFCFSSVDISFYNGLPSNVKIIKEITLKVLSHQKKYPELYDVLLSTFVFDSNIYEEVIEKLEENKIFEIISFLKNDVISGVHYTFSLDYSVKGKIKKILSHMKKIKSYDREKQIYFLLETQQFFSSLGGEKGDCARIYFKRNYLENRFPDIMNLMMGVNNLPQDVFYFLKQKNLTLNLESLRIFSQVKDLILLIEKSYILSFFRPFLLHKISEYFNSNDQKYYIIKFILCLVLTSSYSEYVKISKFFYNLEAFYKKDFKSLLQRILQFGWIIIFSFMVAFFAPFGIIFALLIIFVRYGIMQAVEKYSPELKHSFNFQLGTFAGLLAGITLILASTVGFDENVGIIYTRFSSIINSFTLPFSESWKAFSGDNSALKANILEQHTIK